jgi:hypothetical protein
VIDAMTFLKHMWGSKVLKVDSKHNGLTACVFRVLLFALEKKCYREILRITYKGMIRNEDIREKISKEETIVDMINKRKLKLFGYICRMDDKRLTKHTLFAKMNGKSRRGRPYREWLANITKWCEGSEQDLWLAPADDKV